MILNRARVRRFWKETAKPFLVILLVVTAVRSAIADWNDVPSGSMRPSIVEGDRVFVNKLAYDLKVPYTTWRLAQWGNPKRGDIVVFYSPKDGTRLVKRVVGLPGDQIQMANEELIVNGEAAKYEPLPKSISDVLPPNEQAGQIFASEQVGDTQSHAMMVNPSAQAPRTFGPLVVPAGTYFMMGDNRDNSFDSRFFGPVPRERIVGRATTVVMSLNYNRHYCPRWNRFLSSLK